MKKSKLAIVLIGIVVVALVIIGVLFVISTKKQDTKEKDLSWKWPTEDGYTISSTYDSMYSNSGINISKEEGSNIYAAYDGKVITKSSQGSYGNYIMIEHDNGYYSLYAHLKDFAPNIEEGTSVTKGQVIGYMGMTGAATGPHLHFEIRTCLEYDCTIDPMTVLK